MYGTVSQRERHKKFYPYLLDASLLLVSLIRLSFKSRKYCLNFGQTL
jgi:hypothetical protein